MAQRPFTTVTVVSDDPQLLDGLMNHLRGPLDGAVLCSQAIPPDPPPGVLVLADDIAVGLRESPFPGTPLIVVGRSERPETLRAALRLAARAFVLWPADRDEITRLVLEARPGSPAGRLVALWAPKGGSGASVLAAHLGGALAAAGSPTLLVDLDLAHGDQAAILGAAGHRHTLADLLRVAGEITPEVIETVAWRHPWGFRAVLAPAPSPRRKPEAELASLLAALQEGAACVVADLPSGLGAGALAAAIAGGGGTLMLVVTPDLLCLRRARDAVRGLLEAGAEPAGLEVVLNRFTPGDISREDVEAVLGRPVSAVVRADWGLLRSPDRAELSISGRRALDALARRIAGVAAAPRRRAFHR